METKAKGTATLASSDTQCDAFVILVLSLVNQSFAAHGFGPVVGRRGSGEGPASAAFDSANCLPSRKLEFGKKLTPLDPHVKEKGPRCEKTARAGGVTVENLRFWIEHHYR
jgi:hypothetical protein